MSPHPRYNSRVLAFLSRQFSILRDRTQTAVRHTQMVGRWTAEIISYPFYKLLQAQKILGQNIHKAVQTLGTTLKHTRENPVELQASDDSSTPILRILDAIEVVQQPILASTPSDAHSTTNIIVKVIRPNRISSWVSEGVKRLRTTSRWLQQAVSPQALSASSESTANHSLALQQSPIRFLAKVRNGMHQVFSQRRPTLSKKAYLPQRTETSNRLSWVGRAVKTFSQIRQALSHASSSKTLKTPSALTHSTRLVNSGSGTIRIQGIASLIESHSLVLVTPEQHILDILSPQQQAHLSERMVQEISRFQWRRQKDLVFDRVTDLFNRLRVKGAPKKRQLPGQSPIAIALSSKTWDNVKKWVIHSVISALATLPIVAIPAIAAEATPRKDPVPNYPISTLWVDPNQLKAPIALETPYGLVAHQAQGQMGLRDFKTHRDAADYPLEVHRPNSINRSRISQNGNYTEILVEAEFLGYEPHLLERILGWLDALMVQLESGLTTLWTWTGMIIVLFVTGVQKIQQLLFD